MEVVFTTSPLLLRPEKKPPCPQIIHQKSVYLHPYNLTKNNISRRAADKIKNYIICSIYRRSSSSYTGRTMLRPPYLSIIIRYYTSTRVAYYINIYYICTYRHTVYSLLYRYIVYITGP